MSCIWKDKMLILSIWLGKWARDLRSYLAARVGLINRGDFRRSARVPSHVLYNVSSKIVTQSSFFVWRWQDSCMRSIAGNPKYGDFESTATLFCTTLLFAAVTTHIYYYKKIWSQQPPLLNCRLPLEYACARRMAASRPQRFANHNMTASIKRWRT